MIKNGGDLLKLFDDGKGLMISMVKKMKEHLGPGYRTGDYRMLLLLKKMEKARLRDIAELSGPKPVVCMHLGALERKNIVARETDMADRRNVYYMLTPKGEKYASEIAEKIKNAAGEMFGRLEPKDVRDLAASIEKMNEILAKVVC